MAWIMCTASVVQFWTEAFVCVNWSQCCPRWVYSHYSAHTLDAHLQGLTVCICHQQENRPRKIINWALENDTGLI